MATEPSPDYAFSQEVAAAAAKRWAGRADQQAKFEQARVDDTYYGLDTPARRAARAERLIDKLRTDHPEALPGLARRVAQDPAVPAAAAESMVAGEDIAGLADADTLERVIGATRDFLGIEFLARGMVAARAVVRVAIEAGGRPVGYGTGFLVSPRLLLTNNHVFPDAATAAASRVEFDYQRDAAGRGLPVVGLTLVPDQFFLTDKRLDFALVAVTPDARLAGYGWLPLLRSGGKIVTGEPVCLIQHPKGEMKQVVLWENRLMDVLPDFLHYQADTEPGSSGSPVFNTQWEVVALHHSGVPATNDKKQLLDVDGNVWPKTGDPARIKWVANEGVRASVLIAHLEGRRAGLPAAQQRLLVAAIDGPPPPLPTDPPPPDSPRTPPESVTVPTPTPTGSVTLTVPLTITLSFGPPGSAPAAVVTAGPAGGEESVVIDPDFDGRAGYDPDFLGVNLPFPKLTAATRPKAFKRPGVTGDDAFLLKYHHYSLTFSKDRKLAFCSGVNYDPTGLFTVKREADKWFFDPRVPNDIQCGEDLYAGNPLDRGHLVRRADAGWGHTQAEADRANNDTFHFTNCSPQHAVFNQGKTSQAPPGLLLWGKLEGHVATQGKQGHRKVSVFNGPVFAADDVPYRDICKLPKAFWKLCAYRDDHGQPGAAAFVLSQAALIDGLEEEFKMGEYKAAQVSVADLEGLTKLDFGPLTGWDVFNTPRGAESTGGAAAKVLSAPADMIL